VPSDSFGVSSPLSPEAALVNRTQKTNFDKYLEGERSHPDKRFTHFSVTGFGILGGHATAILESWLVGSRLEKHNIEGNLPTS
jgi:hypothetical protein